MMNTAYFNLLSFTIAATMANKIQKKNAAIPAMAYRTVVFIFFYCAVFVFLENFKNEERNPKNLNL